MGPLLRKDTRVPNSRSLEFVTRRFPTLDSRRSIAAALFFFWLRFFFFLTSTRSHLRFRSPNSSAITITQPSFSSLWQRRLRRSLPQAFCWIHLGGSAPRSSLACPRSLCRDGLLCLSLAPSRPSPDRRRGAYTLNRIQMLLQGLRPYRDFEFAYGPAHLYIPVLFMRLTYGSVIYGYYAWWLSQWLVGTAMLWAAVRLLQLPLLPPRRLLDHLYHPASGHAE